jgi:hypothetical protein
MKARKVEPIHKATHSTQNKSNTKENFAEVLKKQIEKDEADGKYKRS